jgi:MFS family permease
MGDSGAGARAKHASRSFLSASQSAVKAGAAAASGATRTVHRITHASGAGRTGLAHLIELSAAGGIGDSFVAVALAGTLFFSTSVTQARGRVALALIITMAPFALLAPFIGPLLDRVRDGRRFILVGTMLARGLLCWGMAGAVQHNDSLTLLPAAFGVLLLQKAFGVTRASVTPQLLPTEITLVSANSRCALASLIATSAGVPIAAGVSALTGGGASGAGWVLRIGTVLYLAAMVPGLRLPSGLDRAPAEQAAAGQAAAGQAAAGQAAAAPNGQPHTGASPNGQPPAGALPQGRRRDGRGRWKLFPRPVGPVVAEAIGANVTLRAYSGYMIFFLAFLLRIVHFGKVSDHVALIVMAAGVAIGGFCGTAIGAALRARGSQAMIFAMMTAATVVTALCAAFFGLWAAAIVAFAAAVGQTLVKLALDSIVQREISDEVRSSTFAASETLHQLSWVAGGLLGLAMSLTASGVVGLSVAAACLALSLAGLLHGRRARILRARQQVRPA